MKILNESIQPIVAPPATRTDKTGSAAARPNAALKPLSNADKVDFAATLDTSLKTQAQQAKRVEEIKSLMKAGKYQVDSRDVAEKMLAVTSFD
jgi:anti-sigma28 factor (negative regulator of flagellin synthesis)